MSIRKTKDGFAIEANVVLEVKDLKGRILKREKSCNLIPLTGRQLIRDLIGGLRRWPTHMAVGTGTTDPADGDTALQAEVYRELITARVQGSESVKFQFFVGADQANGVDLSEVGLFTVVGDVANTLFARATFTPTTKTSSVTLTISWTVNITSI